MHRKNLYLIIIAVILTAIGFLVWTLFLAPVENQGGQPGYDQGRPAGYNQSEGDRDLSGQGVLRIPDELLGAKKMQEQSGPTAIDAISKMHRTSINVVNAYILVYGKPNTRITLWLSVSSSVEEAAQLFREMDQKVPASQVFTGREPVTLAGREVIKVNGMGQEHFYWQEGKINYWVAIQGEGNREALVKEVMDKVK
ncbi:hypothetical protein [Thermincola ferriacetica]